MRLRRLADQIQRCVTQLEESGHKIKSLKSSVRVPAGKALSRNDVRKVWMKLAANPDSPLLQPEREEILKRYRGRIRGVAPRDQGIKGQPNDSYQLSHESNSHESDSQESSSRRQGGDRVVPRSIIDHALRDPKAYETLPEEGKRLANSMVSSPESDQHYPEDLQAHRQQMRDAHNSLSPEERTEVEELRDRRREEFWDREGYRDYDPRFNDPSSQPEDNRPSAPDDNRPNPPDNNRPSSPEDNRSGGGGFADGLGDLLGRRRR